MKEESLSRANSHFEIQACKKLRIGLESMTVYAPR
jgi:hypothetical protein